MHGSAAAAAATTPAAAATAADSAAAARVLRAILPFFLPPAPQHVRMWLLTLPPALHRYTDDLTGPGGLLLQWDEEVRAAGACQPGWIQEQAYRAGVAWARSGRWLWF